MQNTEEIWRLVDAKQDDFDGICPTASGACPELCYGEVPFLRRTHRDAGGSRAFA